ncbi:GNAT family N-acetyltransferase [Actinoplanes sp. G11-F43]|uniref:GNAT family N-acetyltransferase n=1 Tax=Actinoplanes sp. G11-F43 TaxID=3424130 RepID=UPI003D341388
MTTSRGLLRAATPGDCGALLQLWTLLFGSAAEEPWRGHAADWFARRVECEATARFPVIEVDGMVVATAVGALDPDCVRGRTVRLMNVFTLASHRGQGFGTILVLDVLGWARSIAADRVDLSATADGRRLYERLGFTTTTTRRMNLVL